jgi:copper(I)-binding protein
MRMRNSLRHRAFALVIAILALALAGCAAGIPGGQTMGGAAQQAGAQVGGMQQAMLVPTPEPGKLTVVNVRARPAPLEEGNGAVFLTVLNGLDKAVRLASISGTAAGAIELHETVNENGVMKMEPHPEGFEIPAGDTLELAPGGKHVMLLGLTKPLAVGDSFDLTLNFEGSDPITLTVPVVDIQATMPSATETPKP